MYGTTEPSLEFQTELSYEEMRNRSRVDADRESRVFGVCFRYHQTFGGHIHDRDIGSVSVFNKPAVNGVEY